jgi:hypothetical protein
LIAIIASLTLTIYTAESTTQEEYSKASSRLELHYTQKERARLDSFQRIFNQDHIRSSFLGLTYMWKKELDRFISSPVFGVGIGNSHIAAASAHNVHVQLLTYTGIFGYLLFHMFLFSSFSRFGFSFPDDTLGRDLIYMISLAIMIYLNGITNGLFHGDFNYSLLLVLAIIQNLKHKVVQEEVLSYEIQKEEDPHYHLLPASMH